MITGAHIVIYSQDAEADRAFLRDVLGMSHVDAGDGWLIFGLSPSEAAVHPSERNDVHELYLLCDDIEALIEELSLKDVVCDPLEHAAWGIVTKISLPGGGKLGVYEPRHARPDPKATAQAG